MRYLPEHGFDPRPVTIPPVWVRQQDGEATSAAVEDDPAVLRPTTPADAALARLMDWRGTRKLAREILIPDALAPWAAAVARQVVHRLGPVAAVYATSPPYSAMILADDLGKRLGVPVIQELRDPPSFNRWIKHRSGLTRSRMRRFEGKYLVGADAVITVTPRTRLRLLELHSRLDPDRVHVVTNGYPPIEPEPWRSSRNPDVFTLTFTGTFLSGAKGREDGPFNPTVLVPHLRRLPGPAELRIAGTLLSGQARALAKTGGSIVKTLGHLPRRDAIAEIAAADVAVVVADDDPWWIGRKVFEYLAFARRILAVVPEGDTADLLRASPRAVVVPIGDEHALQAAVSQLYEDWRSGCVPAGEEPFVQTDETCVAGVAEVLRSVLEQARPAS